MGPIEAVSLLAVGLVFLKLGSVLFQNWSKSKKRLRQVRRLISKVERRIKNQLKHLVGLYPIPNKRFLLSLNREIENIDFANWSESTCFQTGNICQIGYQMGSFGRIFYPEATEKIQVLSPVRDILRYLALREITKTKYAIRSLENDFETLPTGEMVNRVLNRPFHSDFWNDIDTVIRDEFPEVFEKMALYRKLLMMEEELLS